MIECSMWKFIIQMTRIQQRLYSTGTKPKNHYNSLGIQSNSTQSEVKSAYYKLSMLHHPDRNQGNDESLQKFRDITEAYEVLGNVKTRKLYDKGLYVHQPQTGKPEEPLSGFYKSRMTRSRPPAGPVTGSVPIYDFDEWSKVHYAQTFQRRQQNKKKIHEYMQMKQEHNDTTKIEKAIVVLVVLLVMGSVYSHFEDYDRIYTGVDTSQYRKKS